MEEISIYGRPTPYRALYYFMLFSLQQLWRQRYSELHRDKRTRLREVKQTCQAHTAKKLAEPGWLFHYLVGCSTTSTAAPPVWRPQDRWHQGPGWGPGVERRQQTLASWVTEVVEPCPSGIKGQHRHSLPSTLSSQVGKRPDHLSGATPTPILQLGPQPLLPRLPPVITASCLAWRLGLVSGGRGAATPLAGAYSEGRGAGSKGYPASWNLGRLGAKAGGRPPRRPVNKYLPSPGLMFPGCGGPLVGTARRARWSETSPDPTPCWDGDWGVGGQEQGAGP